LVRQTWGPPSRKRGDEVEDVIVVRVEPAFAVEPTTNEPKKRFCGETVVQPAPLQGSRRVFDEISEGITVERQAGSERSARREIVGMHNARILHHDAERARLFHSATNALLQVSAKYERDL
jgi:hypothetical protein